jgi:hypothetical protein
MCVVIGLFVAFGVYDVADLHKETQYSTLTNPYMSFDYPKTWHLSTVKDGKEVVIKEDSDNWIRVAMLDSEEDMISREGQLVSLGYADSGWDKTSEGVKYHVFDPPTKLPQAKSVYYLSKNNKYYEVSGTTTFNAQTLIHKIMGSLR